MNVYPVVSVISDSTIVPLLCVAVASVSIVVALNSVVHLLRSNASTVNINDKRQGPICNNISNEQGKIIDTDARTLGKTPLANSTTAPSASSPTFPVQSVMNSTPTSSSNERTEEMQEGRGNDQMRNPSSAVQSISTPILPAPPPLPGTNFY
ncbi:hypothetical protein [Wolbachia endosymbiont of Phyllotreta cruciferae]|uniref:hypothetical protein n=1 Tax=Wolbachia endosymbiont of Phyllotreta cruciferae TaxID=2886377 RepID=UPI00209E9355|nr:hypothetical protein [Wolbachia endosymbiont of Phyllotreta cruciferae]